MKISSVELEGFKRFKSKQVFNTEGRIIAVLGPNEAGKTSLIKALLSIKTASAFVASGPSQETTRGIAPIKDRPILTSKFRVEKTDKDALRSIPGAQTLRWFIIEKYFDGAIVTTTVPKLTRDLERREAVLRRIRKLTKDNDSLSSQALALSAPDLANLLEASLQDRDLPSEVITQLRALMKDLQVFKESDKASLIGEISELISKEGAQHPEDIAKQQLLGRTPEFLVFEEQDRNLLPAYELSPFFDPKGSPAIPRALQNFVTAAELDLKEAVDASRANDQGRLEDLISGANETLRKKMAEAWSQSEIQIRVRLNGTQFTILVSSNKGGFEAISERSDGLRQFVALFALLSRVKAKRSNGVCLLIDEAESRLHYDAQADLVQMLTKQKFAEKVIYTTHSFGCLPEDLGLGIRVVETAKDNTSAIVNKFWSSGIPGFSPVLASMGAATMAFLPVRFSVLTEGAADIILLPSLLREAIGAGSLDFQIAPGLSETGEFQLAALRNEGSRVLFLVDGDEGGAGIAAKLRKAGFMEDKQIVLRSSDKSKRYMTEDFISLPVYVAAINEELERSGVHLKITEDDFREIERPTQLKEWCSRNNIRIPNKVDVAYRVLDCISDGPILEEGKRAELARIHSEIIAGFNQSHN
jgi:predicted ATP-dependent endonuclease of OLD family